MTDLTRRAVERNVTDLTRRAVQRNVTDLTRCGLCSGPGE